MPNPAAALENDIHTFLKEFDIQTDHLILARRPDLKVIDKKKRTCKIVDFAFSADNKIKLKESEKKDNYLDLATELKKYMEHGGDDYTNCDLCTRYSN